MTEYSVEYPGGLCHSCGGRFDRVSRPSSNAGKFAFVRRRNEIGTEVKLHVSCSERFNPTQRTADVDHYAIQRGTAKKPPHQ